MHESNEALAEMKDALTLWVLPNGETLLKVVDPLRFYAFDGNVAYIRQPKVKPVQGEIVELVRKSELETLRNSADQWARHQHAIAEWLLAEARWVATGPTVIHHHDIEKHAESYNEGYADAERQATEPVQGYDEPDASNPAHLRWYASLTQELWKISPMPGGWGIQQVIKRAEVLEQQQADAEAHEHRVAELATIIDVAISALTHHLGMKVGDNDWEPIAREVLEHFEITPKEDGA